MKSNKLTWSLAIPTFRRQHILVKAVGCALRQTRPPKQVVICDSSPDSADTESRIRDLFVANSAVELIFIHSPVAQQTVQRNLALNAVTADIVFCFDDDTLFIDEAAEKIISFFERDVEALIVGLEPGDINPSGAARLFGIDSSAPAATIEKRGHFLYKIAQRWVDPYPRGLTIKHAMPSGLQGESVRFIEGYKIVARTQELKQIGFDQNFINNYGEDAHVTYCLSRKGAIVKIPERLVFHAFENRPDANGRRSGYYRFGALMNSAYRSRLYFGPGLWVRFYSVIVWSRFLVLDFAVFLSTRQSARLKGTFATLPSLFRLAFASQERAGEVLREETLRFKARIS